MSLPWQNTMAASIRGFTIVELITTIILLSILSGVAMSTMVSSSSFAPSTIVHQLDLELSLAHGVATARQDVTVSLELLAEADTWLIRTSNSSDGVTRSTAVDAYNSTINVTSGAATSGLSNLNTLMLNYSGRGEIVSATLAGASVDPTQGIQFELIGDTSRTLCLYPTGIIDHAACV